MLGVEHSRKVIQDMGDLGAGLVVIVKKGIGLGSIRQLLDLLGAAKDLIAQAPAALPELADIDQAEAQVLAGEAYQLVRKIVGAIAQPH